MWKCLRNLMAFERSIKNTLLYTVFSEFVKELEENIPFIYFLIASRKRMGLYFD